MQAASARIAELEAELSEMKDRWMRAEAETANVRARGQREVNETRQYAVQKFAQDVVEAAENLQRGLDSLPAPATGEPEIVTRMREGLEGIERNFLAILERNGIKREDPTGTPFDPNLHQAMSEQESAAHAPGSVMHAWTPVWTLNGSCFARRWWWSPRRRPARSHRARAARHWTPPPDGFRVGLARNPPPAPCPTGSPPYIHVTLPAWGRSRCFGSRASAERSQH